METGSDLVTPGTLNPDCLCSIYNEAYMDCKQDGDGDPVITDSGLKCIAMLRTHREEIHLAIYFPLKDDVSPEKKIESANRINDRYAITRASVTMDFSVLMCDYYIFLKGGVSRKAIVLGTRRFIEATREAIVKLAPDIIMALDEPIWAAIKGPRH